jgi:alpha-mannosidase
MSATYDIQFGHVSRPTHENTSWDEARFETYAHKWMDLSENGYGVSLLSANKYGYSVLGSTVGITLLKCPTDPNPHADRGEHHFTYAMMPHVGDFRQAGVITEAWSLNQPLMCQAVEARENGLASQFSLVSCDAPNMVATALKKAEDGEDLILRMYDAFDCKSTVTVTLPEGTRHAELCDLMETSQRTLSLENGRVTFPVSNFEIVTLRFGK